MKQRKNSTPRRYKQRMLRDFLTHLDWEVRIRHAEHHHLQGKVNDELAEALAKYQLQYKCYGLLKADMFVPDPTGQVSEETALPVLDDFLRKRSERWMRAWSDLEDLFAEALDGVGYGLTPAVRTWTAAEIMERLAGGDQEHPTQES